ncbi:hypothetical protein BDV32DRAFT_124505 [Aspergillus pseudonomiae]|nr:hypothetical protein BDV32DRAFT_124505 [Aspergillus pseudonomiae]
MNRTTGHKRGFPATKQQPPIAYTPEATRTDILYDFLRTLPKRRLELPGHMTKNMER